MIKILFACHGSILKKPVQSMIVRLNAALTVPLLYPFEFWLEP